jgi:hypothetical protein
MLKVWKLDGNKGTERKGTWFITRTGGNIGIGWESRSRVERNMVCNKKRVGNMQQDGNKGTARKGTLYITCGWGYWNRMG